MIRAMPSLEREQRRRRQHERRLTRTGIVVVGPLIAAATIAWGVLDFAAREGDWSLETLAWGGPALTLLMGFLGLAVGFFVGGCVGWAVGWAWKGRDYGPEGMEIGGAGGAVGGLVGGLVVVLYLAV
jgi:hypothetical protein